MCAHMFAWKAEQARHASKRAAKTCRQCKAQKLAPLRPCNQQLASVRGGHMIYHNEGSPVVKVLTLPEEPLPSSQSEPSGRWLTVMSAVLSELPKSGTAFK